MKKYSSKVIAIVLSVMMVFGAFAVCASAGTNTKTYENYDVTLETSEGKIDFTIAVDSEALIAAVKSGNKAALKAFLPKTISDAAEGKSVSFEGLLDDFGITFNALYEVDDKFAALIDIESVIDADDIEGIIDISDEYKVLAEYISENIIYDVIAYEDLVSVISDNELLACLEDDEKTAVGELTGSERNEALFAYLCENEKFVTALAAAFEDDAKLYATVKAIGADAAADALKNVENFNDDLIAVIDAKGGRLNKAGKSAVIAFVRDNINEVYVNDTLVYSWDETQSKYVALAQTLTDTVLASFNGVLDNCVSASDGDVIYTINAKADYEIDGTADEVVLTFKLTVKGETESLNKYASDVAESVEYDASKGYVKIDDTPKEKYKVSYVMEKILGSKSISDSEKLKLFGYCTLLGADLPDTIEDLEGYESKLVSNGIVTEENLKLVDKLIKLAAKAAATETIQNVIADKCIDDYYEGSSVFHFNEVFDVEIESVVARLSAKKDIVGKIWNKFNSVAVLDTDTIKIPADITYIADQVYRMRYYDADRTTLLYTVYVPVGADLDLFEEQLANYAPYGWVDADGNIDTGIVPGADTDFYPLQKYTIVFDANGGDGTMESIEVMFGEEVKLPASTFTRDGYTFEGWNTAADGSGDSYDDEATVKNLVNNGEIVLYAIWEEIPEESSVEESSEEPSVEESSEEPSVEESSEEPSVEESSEEPSVEESSEESVPVTPAQGDAGVVALAIVAVVTAAGVVVVKKRK